MIETSELMLKIRKSEELLELAEQYAQRAEQLPEGDDKRKWLEAEASALLEEARSLTDEVLQKTSKFESKVL
jgi:hypothetical protein